MSENVLSSQAGAIVQALQGARAFDVTPNDSADLSVTNVNLYIGTGGNVKVDMQSGGTVTFKNVANGTFLPIRVKRVYSTVTGTAASDIVAFY